MGIYWPAPAERLRLHIISVGSTVIRAAASSHSYYETLFGYQGHSEFSNTFVGLGAYVIQSFIRLCKEQ